MTKITERTPRSLRYQDQTPIAILSLSAFSAIAIYQPDEIDIGTCEFVVADLNDRNELIKLRRVTTHYDKKKTAFPTFIDMAENAILMNLSEYEKLAPIN